MNGRTIVETAGGRVRGASGPRGLAFQGVPYARAARFAPPVPARTWTGVRDALIPGPAAPQPWREVALFTHGPTPDTDEERCLSVNVFTPGRDGARPVLVWIHGGGFAVGHGAASLYHGAGLAVAADAVVVTLNYRLGSLGWLCHPALAGGPGRPAGNWGLLDQLGALRWVSENIAAFGGDPAQVTLAGQSAGALSAMDLLVVPEAAGLFVRAILQSPPLVDLAQPIEPAVVWAEALSAAAGGTGDIDPAHLRGLGADALVALHEELLDDPRFRGTRGGALPTRDPGSLPVSPVERPGASPAVDVLIGATAEEGTFFFRSPWRPPPAAERVPAIVGHLTGSEDPAGLLAAAAAAAAARGTSIAPGDLLVDIATEAMIAGPAARWARDRAAELRAAGASARVSAYRVEHPGAGPRLGATHTVEVPLLFGTWGDGEAGERLGGQAAGASAVAAELQAAWARFLHGDDLPWGSVEDDELGVFGGSAAFRIEPASPPLTRSQPASAWP